MATTNGLLPKPLVSAEIATLRNDITRNYLGIFLEKQDNILKTKAGLGWNALELYEAVRDDSQVSSCMAQLIDSIVSYEVEIVPGQRKGSSVGRQEKRAADYIGEIVERIKYDRITRQSSWGFFYGYFVNELLLMRDGAVITLDDTKGGIRIRDRKRFQFDFDLNVRLLTPDNMWDGEIMHPSRVWTDNFGADHGDEPYGLGLAHFLYWMVVFKKGGFKAWLQFLERFASGTPVVKYPPGTDDEGKKDAIEVAQAISAGSSLSMSDNLALEIVEATRSGTADYSTLIDKCNAAIAKGILGQTMTTDDGSSLSQAQVHENVGNKIIKSYADLLSESFNDNVVKRLCGWNFPDAVPPKVWRKTTASEDINVRADRDVKLFDLGIRLDPKAVTKIYGEDYLVAQQDTTVLLNGAQITSLNQLIKDAASGAIPIESARQLAIAALSIPEAIADKIIQPLLDKEKEAQEAAAKQAEKDANLFPDTGNNNGTPPAPLPSQNAPAFSESEFAEFYALEKNIIQFAAKPASAAPKKKNCTKGTYCVGKTGKGSCVSGKCKAKAGESSANYGKVLTSKVGEAKEEPKTVLDRSNSDTANAYKESKNVFAEIIKNGEGDPLPPPPNASQAAAINRYTSKEYIALNQHLRTGKTPEGYEEKELAAMRDLTQEGLKQMPEYKAGNVYRGTGIPDEIIKKYIAAAKSGDPITEPGFLSTTSDKKIANVFTNKRNGNSNVLFEIKPKSVGTSARDVVSLSAFGNGEKEVLFGHSSQFKVARTRKTKTGYEILLEEV